MDKFTNKYKDFKRLHMSDDNKRILKEATEGAKDYLNGESLDDIDLEKTEAFLSYCTQSLFAVLWADWTENETDEHIRGNILEKAPVYADKMSPDEAKQLESKTESLIEEFERANDNEDILFLYRYAIELDQQQPSSVDDRSTLEMFGLMVILKMLGEGVSWEDDHNDPVFDYPNAEASYLEYPDSFPTRGEEPQEEEEQEEVDDWENPDFWNS